MKRWKDWSLVSSDGTVEGELKGQLDTLLSGVGGNHLLLKKGRGHQVIMTVNSDGKRAIKLYTPKKGLRGLLHSLLPSKAFMEYCVTQRLFSLGVPVPKPLAAAERRWFPGNGKSILITEYMEGYERVNRVFSSMEGEERGPFLEALARFVKRLHATCFCHADLWARNILVKDKKDFLVIDMDGGYFNCRLLPIRVPVNLAQLLFSMNRASPLSAEEVERFLEHYGATRKTIERTIKTYQRKKFGPWPWKGGTL